jgi:hypothetical protein
MPGLALTPPLRTAAARTLRGLGPAAAGAGALSLLTGWVHLAYIAPHWDDWWAYGVFFLAAGAFQALCAPAIVRRPRSAPVALAAIAGNLAIVGMYVLSRTAGVPLGPHEGVVEEAGAIDLAVTAAEIATVLCLVTLLGARLRRIVVDVMLASGLLLWALRLTERLP